MSTKNKKSRLSVVNNPHDNFFVKSLSNITLAREFLLQHLPQPLLEVLDLSSLKICKDRIVDETLRSRYTDVIFELRFKNSTQKAYIVTHIEHQSTPQDDMPVRVLLYESGIIKNHWYNHKQIPLIYSLVYYNGQEVWRYPTNLKAMIDAPADLIDRYFLQPFQLVSLNEIPDEELRKWKWAGIMGIFMKHIFDRDVLPIIKQFIDRLRQIEQEGRQDFSSSILCYIISRGEISDKGAFKALVASNLSQNTGEKIMTLAQQWEQEGFERGMTLAEQWRQEGFERGMTLAEQWRQEGFERGMTLAEQWRQEGLEEGMEKGVEKGMEKGRLIVAASMLTQGFKPEVIAQAIGLSIEKVYALNRNDGS